MADEESDEFWVERFLAGEASAFDQLVRRTQGRLYSSIVKIVGSREEALDVLQETYIKIFRNMSRFQRGAAFSTWAYRIAVNQSISHRRKRRLVQFSVNQNNTESDEFDHDPEDPHSQESNLDRLARLERNQLVEKALNSLPTAQRAVLVMCDYDELRYDEIAAILDVPIGTVRSRIHRAREELRKKLTPLLNEPAPTGTSPENSGSGAPSASPATNPVRSS
ncbi:MAG: RNA polymerase sigma factor [bacterium]